MIEGGVGGDRQLGQVTAQTHYLGLPRGSDHQELEKSRVLKKSLAPWAEWLLFGGHTCILHCIPKAPRQECVLGKWK